jgi:hypothetical protein
MYDSLGFFGAFDDRGAFVVAAYWIQSSIVVCMNEVGREGVNIDKFVKL